MTFVMLLILLTTLLLLTTKRIDQGIWLVAGQGFLLALVTLLLGFRWANSHYYLGVISVLVVKGLLVPAVLFLIMRKIKIKRTMDLVISPGWCLLIAVTLILLSYWVASAHLLIVDLAAKELLPGALALLLLGLLLMITRKKAISQLLGLLVMENGIYLAAIAATQGMPFMVELGVFLDILIAVIIMGLLVFKIDQTFDSINTDKLTSLKG